MESPYITPSKLLSTNVLPFDGVKTAFVCFCPMPSAFNKYKLNVEINTRLFLHVHNMHVIFCQYETNKFIVVTEVYGGPVGVTIVEELKHYGIDKIIGIGFVGSFDPAIKTGSIVDAEKALIEHGTTPHYLSTDTEYTFPTLKIELSQLNTNKVCIWTTNALYREFRSDIIKARNKQCSVVNMDTSHLYAACELLNIPCQYFAVVSDVLDLDGVENWSNDLTDAINHNDSDISVSVSSLIDHIVRKIN